MIPPDLNLYYLASKEIIPASTTPSHHFSVALLQLAEEGTWQSIRYKSFGHAPPTVPANK